MVGPDLGSDESPRSSVNSNEWNTLLEDDAAIQRASFFYFYYNLNNLAGIAFHARLDYL